MKTALLASAVLLTTWVASAASARADAQWSTRLGLGGGVASNGDASQEGVFELRLAADLLWGGARPNVVRVGPLVDLRTSDFSSAEMAAGASVSLPLMQGFPMTVSGGLGYALREADRDAPFALGRLAFGYHPYNYLSSYAYALNVYADVRHDVGPHEAWSITGGVEIDLEFIVVIPVMFIAKFITRGDPDEPE